MFRSSMRLTLATCADEPGRTIISRTMLCTESVTWVQSTKKALGTELDLPCIGLLKTEI